jgi:hypothetical protein
MAYVVNYPIRKAVKNFTLTVNISGLRAWRCRVWIGVRLIKLAALVIGCGFHVDNRP